MFPIGSRMEPFRIYRFVSGPWPSEGDFDLSRGALSVEALLLQHPLVILLRLQAHQDQFSCFGKATEKHWSWAFG